MLKASALCAGGIIVFASQLNMQGKKKKKQNKNMGYHYEFSCSMELTKITTLSSVCQFLSNLMHALILNLTNV